MYDEKVCWNSTEEDKICGSNNDNKYDDDNKNISKEITKKKKL